MAFRRFASFVLILAVGGMPGAFACPTGQGPDARADALRRVSIKYQDLNLDNVSQTAVATGNVVITRGTTVLHSDRAVVKEAPDGYRHFVLTAAPGKLASFRQKRDGGPDLWTEGRAERIEYDERSDTIELHASAMLRQLEGQRVTHQMEQAFISYDNGKNVLLGRNGPGGADAGANARGTITIEAHRPRPANTSPADPAAGQPRP